MPRRDGTGPFGTFKDCVAPDGIIRPRRRYLDPNARPGLGMRLGRGRGRRGGW